MYRVRRYALAVRRTINDPERVTILEPIDRLEVWLVNGRLNIVAAPGPCRVEVNSSGGKPLQLDVEHGRLRVRHLRAPWWAGVFWWWARMRFRCEVTIGVPPQVFANLRVNEGNVTVSGLRTNTHVNVMSGRVSLLGLGGKTAVKLVSGDVEALRVTGELFMKTISGDLAVAESGANKVHAKTISGTITCDLDEAQPTELILHTTSGDIIVRVPVESDLDVVMRTTSGRITSSFAEVVKRDPIGFSKHASGVIGTGGGKLQASTTSGDVSLLAFESKDELE